MVFKNYELRLMPNTDSDYEIVKWDKHHKGCSAICFLRLDTKTGRYTVDNIGIRPFEACAQTNGFAGWIQKTVETLEYIHAFEGEDDFEE